MTSPVASSVRTTNGDLKHDEKADVPRLSESPAQFAHDDEDGVTSKQNGELYSGSDDEGTDYEEEDEDEDEGDEDDEEPALKYERIGGSIPDLLKKDAASALSIANKLMVKLHYCVSTLQILNFVLDKAIGTHGGIVHILGLNGKRIKSYKPHLASIIDISMDSTGDFVSTASLDGEPPDFAYVSFSYTTPRTGRNSFLIYFRVVLL
jgi:vacuolar protein sorting-associated protein 41